MTFSFDFPNRLTLPSATAYSPFSQRISP